jgi:hypothetical protein
MTKSSRKLGAVLLSIAAVAAIPATASAQTSTTVRINVQHSGKALTSVNGTIQQRPYIGTTNQKWSMISLGSVGGSKVAFRYRNIQTGKCLDLETSPNAGGSGTVLAQRLCDSSKFTQHWVRDFSINASFLQTINRASGLAMTVRGGSTSDFATIDQEFPSGLAHQKWSVFGV